MGKISEPDYSFTSESAVNTVFAIVLSYFLMIEFLSEILGVIGYVLSYSFMFFLAYFHFLLGWKRVSQILLIQVLDYEISYLIVDNPMTSIAISIANTSFERAFAHGARGFGMILGPMIIFISYLLNLWLIKRFQFRKRVGRFSRCDHRVTSKLSSKHGRYAGDFDDNLSKRAHKTVIHKDSPI